MFRWHRILAAENRLSSASIILIVTLTASNVLGWVRLHFLAQKIPADILDTYVAAFRLPDLVFNLLVLGAISSAFIPIFADYLARKKDQEAWHIARSILTLLVIILFFLIVPLYFVIPLLTPYLVPHFDAAREQMVIDQSRIFLLSPLIFGVSYVVGGILNSFQRFLAYSLAPLLYNLAIITGTILFADRYSVYGVAWSVVVGALLHLAIQLVPAFKLGLTMRPVIDITHRAVRKVGILMIPRIMGMAANQIMLIVFTAIASISGGANFIFDSMNNIQTMPTVVFGTSFATAIFPLLSRHAALSRKDLFRDDIIRMARWVIFLLIPASAGLILLRAQVVRLVLGSGHFGWEETIIAASTLGFFAVSLVFSGLIPLLARAFYAMKDTFTPMLISSIAAVIAIGVGYLLTRGTMQVAPALALSFSVGAVINALLLYALMDRRLGGGLNGNLLSFGGKVVLATIVMTLVVQGIKYWIGTVFPLERTVWLALQTMASMAVGIVVFWGSAMLLKLPEASRLPRAIWNRSATLPS
jgi:putative peptidoglycan lipid II flippase